MEETAAIIIPARMASTRFPHKPFALIKKMTMIERVWRIGRSVGSAAELVIATDDDRLKQFAESFGAQVMMTSPHCLTGTDRVAEASAFMKKEHAVIFSLQGDAVLTPPWIIDEVIVAMLGNPLIPIATPAVELRGRARADFIASKKNGSTSGTSVVFNKRGEALYFSKTLIPYVRDDETPVFRHIGLYGYRKDVLQTLGQLPEGPLEKGEKLEQLRALENGIPIHVIPVDYQGRTHGSVDRPEDIAIIEKIIEQEGELPV